MKNNRIEEQEFKEIAERFGVEPNDVKNVVNSFFDVIISEAGKLPFDNPRKIFSRAAFGNRIKVRNIPYIGRIGPAYSRYLKWRRNEAKGIRMIPRPNSKAKLLHDEIEAIADLVLNGGTYVPKEKSRKKPYKRVWMVDEGCKRQARQVIPKEENIK